MRQGSERGALVTGGREFKKLGRSLCVEWLV
jgi:hypothetical protein